MLSIGGIVEPSKVGSWLQIGANVGILAGLVLVSVQIIQSNDITGAELFSDNLESTVTRDLALVGETPDESMWRVIHRPDEATPKDYFIANHLYLVILKQLNRANALSDAGLYGTNANIDARGFASINFHLFSCPYGVAWLDAVLASIPPEIAGYSSIKLMRDLAFKAMTTNRTADILKRAEILARQVESISK